MILPEGGSLPVGHVVSYPETGTLKLSAKELHSPPPLGPSNWRRLTQLNQAVIALHGRKNNKYHLSTDS